jgi:preprotein translocase subunit SecG
MTTTLIVFQFILAATLTISVLLQKSSSIGLGAYSGSNESLFGAKGPAGFIQKFTFVVALVFVVNTLSLGYIYNKEKKASIAEDIKVQKVIPDVPKVPETPTKNQAPTAPKSNN